MNNSNFKIQIDLTLNERAHVEMMSYLRGSDDIWMDQFKRRIPCCHTLKQFKRRIPCCHTLKPRPPKPSVALTLSGTGCSKLTTLLDNVSLKFQRLIFEIQQYFLLKKCEKLLQCKSFFQFFNKKF